MRVSGVYTALVTPFKLGKIDFISLEKLIRQQMSGGINKFVVNGTTAESPTLFEEESLEILKFVLEKTNKKAQIIFGSGSNSTEKTILLSQKAQQAGAHGLLLVVPYYNKPPQAGLVAHFRKIAEAVDLPQILYNVPSRTITSLEVESILQLSKLKNIVGIKEATGQLDFDQKIIDAVAPPFSVLSGDDESCFDLQKRGGQGVISVCSHIMPNKMSHWFERVNQEKSFNEYAGAQELIAGLYMSTNPIPVKAALQILGVIESDEVRLPLCPLSTEAKNRLVELLKKHERFLA